MTEVLRSYLNKQINTIYDDRHLMNLNVLSEHEKFKYKKEIEQYFSTTTAKFQIPFRNYKKLNWKLCDENSDQIILSNDSDSCLFNPIRSYGTTAIRSTCSLKRNTYTYWQVTIGERVFGSSIMVGIGRKNAKKSTVGFLNLLGCDSNSWGLSHKGYAWHRNDSKRYCNEFDEHKKVQIGCLFNGFNGDLAFFINGVYMGIAFHNIPMQHDNDLYPMFSTTTSKCLMKLDFSYETFPTLQEICRLKLIENKKVFNSIRMQYPFLPKFIEQYLED